MDIEINSFEYAPLSNRFRNLKVIFGPRDRKNRVIFYIHDDVWSDNDSSKDMNFLISLAGNGFTIVVPELESGHVGGLKAVMEDIHLALRWTKINLETLGSDGNFGIAMVASGYGAQLALLSYACNYSESFGNLLELRRLDLNLKGIALISPLTDVREIYVTPDDQSINASFRKNLLSKIYGPNYQDSNLFMRTSSSSDYARTLAACKAKIMVQCFKNDELFIANQKIVDNLKMAYLEPIDKIYAGDDLSFGEYIQGTDIDKYKDQQKDIISFISNLWNYD